MVLAAGKTCPGTMLKIPLPASRSTSNLSCNFPTKCTHQENPTVSTLISCGSTERSCGILSRFFYFKRAINFPWKLKDTNNSYECFCILAFCDIQFLWGLSLATLVNQVQLFAMFPLCSWEGHMMVRGVRHHFHPKSGFWCLCLFKKVPLFSCNVVCTPFLATIKPYPSLTSCNAYNSSFNFVKVLALKCWNIIL